MKYDVSVDKNLFKVYPEIRLGLLRFHAEVHRDLLKDYLETVWKECFTEEPIIVCLME